jgi:hypothetical protein
VASIEEVKAEALLVLEDLRGMWSTFEHARNRCTEIGTESARVLQGSGRDEANTAISRIRSTEMNLDDGIANVGIAIEALEQLIAAL